MIDVLKAREILKLLYNTPTWRLSVDKLSNRRVMALYFSSYNKAQLRKKNGVATKTDTLFISTFNEIVSSKSIEKQKKLKTDTIIVEQLSFLND